ncbi:Peptidase C78 [Trypanosoma melophagium]|uniref:Peptidase C78 n=1 Tax=Trypanosoma melophagium TaxID=715481 RepID=UPI00351A58EC|nr:Peptidase C78 [Trypanosoma melophagium]
MSNEIFSTVSLEDELPLIIVRKSGKTVAVVRDETLQGCFLPFSLRACDVQRISDQDALQEARTVAVFDVVMREWAVKAKLRVSLDGVSAHTHWIVLQPSKGTARERRTETKAFKGTQDGLCEAVKWLKCMKLHGSYEMCVASEPVFSELSVAKEIGCLRLIQEDEGINERIIFGDSATEIALFVEDFLNSFFQGKITESTAVYWPSFLMHPVNIRYKKDEVRIAEHNALLLPMRPLLHLKQRIKDWATADEVRPSPAVCVPRLGQTWEKHLVRNAHENLRSIAPIKGGQTFLVSGMYDYYHYRVDGFKDDGWGCAYRSLQTILSWFQYEGLMDKPMPDISGIQEILSLKDPEKMNRKDFVGSKDWIGSFEIMIVIQHFIPGIECTVKRMESGSDLDTDPTVQQLLLNHFRQKRACPIMIGGSSYAHTILGIDVNLDNMEARYLIADPHYSSPETVMKTVINKGYVGWKDAGNFFESKSWYNLCIPQLLSYDPR